MNKIIRKILPLSLFLFLSFLNSIFAFDGIKARGGLIRTGFFMQGQGVSLRAGTLRQTPSATLAFKGSNLYDGDFFALYGKGHFDYLTGISKLNSYPSNNSAYLMDKEAVKTNLLSADEITFTQSYPDWTLSAQGDASLAALGYTISMVFGGENHKFFMTGIGFGVSYVDYSYDLLLCQSYTKDTSGDYERSNGKCVGSRTIKSDRLKEWMPVGIINFSLYEYHTGTSTYTFLGVVGYQFNSVVYDSKDSLDVNSSTIDLAIGLIYTDLISYTYYW